VNKAVFINVKREELVADIVNKTFKHNFKYQNGTGGLCKVHTVRIHCLNGIPTRPFWINTSVRTTQTKKFNATVQLPEAKGNLKYVRTFNLFPEVEDIHIENTLREYGKIKKHVRENFSAAMEVDTITGVRGVCMEMERPVPTFLSIGNLRTKFVYQGMAEGCFNCNSTGHLRKECPKRF
jgi:Zinc knuckle